MALLVLTRSLYIRMWLVAILMDWNHSGILHHPKDLYIGINHPQIYFNASRAGHKFNGVCAV